MQRRVLHCDGGVAVSAGSADEFVAIAANSVLVWSAFKGWLWMATRRATLPWRVSTISLVVSRFLVFFLTKYRSGAPMAVGIFQFVFDCSLHQSVRIGFRQIPCGGGCVVRRRFGLRGGPG